MPTSYWLVRGPGFALSPVNIRPRCEHSHWLQSGFKTRQIKFTLLPVYQDLLLPRANKEPNPTWTPNCSCTSNTVGWNHWINLRSTSAQAERCRVLGGTRLCPDRKVSHGSDCWVYLPIPLLPVASPSTSCSLKPNEWMSLAPSRPAWGSTELRPLTIIYEAVSLLKLTRCCLLALLVQRITESFIKYLSAKLQTTWITALKYVHK